MWTAGSRTTAASGRKASTSWRSTWPNSRRGTPMARRIEAAGSNVIPFRRRSGPRPDWIAAYVRFWTENLDQLSAYIEKLQAEEKLQMSDLKFDYPKDEP